MAHRGLYLQVVAAAALSGAAAGQAQPAPSNWIGQLPSAEAVTKAMSYGKDPQDTAIRQAAALLVLMDVIETFTGKSVGALSEMPRLAEVRYREYADASNAIYRGAKAPVWKLKVSKEFAEDVLARAMPSVKATYWTARTARDEALLNRYRSSMAAPPSPPENAAPPVGSGLRLTPMQYRKWREGIDKAKGRYRTYDSDVRRMAIADGKAADNSDYMTFFGIPLGAPLTLPDCEDVGTWEPGSDPPRMNSLKTCILFENVVTYRETNGSASIYWARGSLPSWAGDVEVILEGNVPITASFGMASGEEAPGAVTARRWGVWVTTEPTLDEIQAYKARNKELRAHAERVRADLRAKYGPPVDKAGTEWARPGLHVTYTPRSLWDSVLIEVASVHNRRVEGERREKEANKAAEPKL
jgi:hypothetical protein